MAITQPKSTHTRYDKFLQGWCIPETKLDSTESESKPEQVFAYQVVYWITGLTVGHLGRSVLTPPNDIWSSPFIFPRGYIPLAQIIRFRITLPRSDEGI